MEAAWDGMDQVICTCMDQKFGFSNERNKVRGSTEHHLLFMGLVIYAWVNASGNSDC